MKNIITLLFLFPFFLSAQESGFHGYGDIIRVQQITTDTFELRTVFTGGYHIDGQYIVDSLKVDDRIFISCAPYPIVSISLQTSGITIFRVWDKNNKGMPPLGARVAFYRESTNKQFVRTNISNANNYGISPNELNCLTQKLISQLDTIISDGTIPWAQIEQSDTIGAIAIAGSDSVGYWSDSLRFWQGKLRIGVDTAATLADVRTGAVNFANADLTLTGNRIHDLTTFDLKFTDNSNNPALLIEGQTGRVGLGTDNPDGIIQVTDGTGAGVVYNPIYDKFIYESDDFVNFALASPRDKFINIAFHDEDNRAQGGIRYDHRTDALHIWTNDNTSIFDFTIKDGRFSLNDNTPDYTFDLKATDAIMLPQGTTAQRPTPRFGVFRGNSSRFDYEGYNGTEWRSFAWYNTTNFVVDNYNFDIDQSVGLGQDNYVLTYDDPSGEIRLEAPSGTDGNGVFSASNNNGTIPTSFSAELTDSLSFGTATYPDKFQIDSFGVIISRLPTESNSTIITTGNNVDWSNLRGSNLIIGTNLNGDLGTKANYDGNVLLGPLTYTTGGNNNYFNTIVGYDAYSSGDNPKNTVLGSKANAQSVAESTAVGYSTSVTGAKSLAIGALSSATAEKSIALGHGSIADETGEITLGDATNQTKFNVGNYTFNVNQSVGSSQNKFKLSYDDDSEEILLEPNSKSTHAQLKETALTSLGTLSTSYEYVKSLTSQNLSNFTATDSTLTYTGSETILVEINYSGSVFFDISTSGTYNTSFLTYVNGTQKLEAISTAQMTADGAEDWIFPFSGTTWVELSTSDVISLRRKGSAALTASLSNLSLTVKAL